MAPSVWHTRCIVEDGGLGKGAGTPQGRCAMKMLPAVMLAAALLGVSANAQDLDEVAKEIAEAAARVAATSGAANAAAVVTLPEMPGPAAPTQWQAAADGPEARRLADAVRALAAARNDLAALLEKRGKDDAAREGATDVVLHLNDALVSYANAVQRPIPVTAPQWQDFVGQSLDRIHGMRAEFMPEREDGRFWIGRRGGKWFGPRMSLLTSKFRQQYHLRAWDAAGVKAGPAGVSGVVDLTSVRGDFRYDMHFSGEGTGNAVAELGGGGGGFFPDWWVGPREALHPWTQTLKLTANRRQGWILDAAFSTNEASAYAATPGVAGSIWAWAEEGRLYRGAFLSPFRVLKWKAGNKTFEAELAVSGGREPVIYTIQAGLSDSDSGVVKGTVRLPANNRIEEHKLLGTLYRAFVGTYESGGMDGQWSQELLAGVASSEPESIPTLLPPPSSPAQLFEYGLDAYRQVAALDWALREYPLPFGKALQFTRHGVDDRSRLWYAGWDKSKHSPKAAEHLHLALAWAMGRDAAGAAAYLETLATTARRAVADRRAATEPVVGLSATTDPEFSPTAKDWFALRDWSCFGFVTRCWSFDTGPYLPEMLVNPAPRPDGKNLVAGKPVRVGHGNPREHMWFWRATADPVDGAICIPIECVRVPGEERDTWGHVTEDEGYKKYLDGSLINKATWYATTTFVAERASRVWLATRIEWDGRLWVNDSLVWRPDRLHTPYRTAVVPVDFEAGTNRITVCVSPRPTSDGNSGKFGPWLYKYGERAYGSAAVWISRGGEPRKPEVVAARRAKEDKADQARPVPEIRGRRGDGSGRYPDATPALAWDLEKGINVRWKAVLPTDDAEPVVVGEKVFVTTFEGELACLDAKTGKELWRRRPEIKGAPPPDRAKYPPTGLFASFAPARRWKTLEKTVSANTPALKRSCLTVLAGKDRVWMHDPAGAVACFDHEGAPIWARAVPAQIPRFVTGGYIGVRLCPPTHPAIVGKRLVAAVGEGMAAFDIETGAQAWLREKLDYNGHFAVMDFSEDRQGKLILLSSCEVLDAADGGTLIPRCAPLMPDSTCQPVVEGRIAYFNACSSAVRFWHDESGGLRHELLWDSPTDIRKRQSDQNHGNHNGAPDADFFGQSTGAFPPTPVLYNGTLFVHLAEPLTIMRGHQNSMRLQTYDAATGCAVAQRYALLMNGMRPASSAIAAGGYVFLPDEGCTIPYNYINFPQGIPMISIVTAEDEPRRVSESRGLASLAPPVFSGRRMYMAGSDQVVCVERPEALGDKFSDCELAALKTVFFTKGIGKEPGTEMEVAIEPPAFLKVGNDVPVVALKPASTPSPWLFAGPFFVDPATDVFQDRGGAGAIQPEAGMTVSYTTTNGAQGEATFVLLDDKDAGSGGLADSTKKKLIDRGYAGALRNGKLEGAINCATATGRKYNTTCYAYMVLEASEAGVHKIEVLGGKLKGYDLYMAGKRVQNGTVVDLKPGRYPLMARVAIAACGDWEQLEFGVHFRPVPKALPPPTPLADPLPQGLRVSIEPLQFGERFPVTAVGAWPLDENAAEQVVRAILARPGALVGLGDTIEAGGTRATFKEVPDGLLRDPKSARGVFCAVVEYDRDIAVEFTMPESMRCWLSGREVFTGEAVPLAAGRYSFMMALGATVPAKAAALVPAVLEVASPAVERQRWLARIRKNEKMLRAIAASGPNGAYAQEALDALAKPAR
jgi:hypothetical protein